MGSVGFSVPLKITLSWSLVLPREAHRRPWITLVLHMLKGAGSMFKARSRMGSPWRQDLHSWYLVPLRGAQAPKTRGEQTPSWEHVRPHGGGRAGSATCKLGGVLCVCSRKAGSGVQAEAFLRRTEKAEQAAGQGRSGPGPNSSVGQHLSLRGAGHMLQGGLAGPVCSRLVHVGRTAEVGQSCGIS